MILVKKVEEILLSQIKDKLNGQIIELEDEIAISSRINKRVSINLVWKKRQNLELDDVYEWLKHYEISIKASPFSFINKKKVKEEWRKKCEKIITDVVEDFREFVSSVLSL